MNKARILEMPIERSNSSDGVSLDKQHLKDMLLFLARLADTDASSFKPGNIKLRQENILKAEDDELFKWVNEGAEQEWNLHPSFYHAIVAELKNRKAI